MGTQVQSQNGSETLNVILHGAFTFDQTTQPGRILALIPPIPYHVHRAGSWLAEAELSGRTGSEAVVYELVGVKESGDAKLDPAHNLMVKPDQRGTPKTFPYATLKFPLPQQITSLLVADVGRNDFTDNQELVVNGDPQHIATLQIFTYEIKDLNQLMLTAEDGDGHYWEPVLTEGHVNLHIFAAEDHYHKPSNAQEDFNQCADLIGGLKLRLQTQRLPASGLSDSLPLPPGVDPRETETLALRNERMARLGRLVTQNGDANLAWYGNDALDGDPDACGGPGC